MVESSPVLAVTQLYAWGLSAHGQLGIGKVSKKGEMLPVKVKLPGVQSCSIFSSAVLALASGGKLFGWGSNIRCKLGLQEDEKIYESPIEIKLKIKLLQVSCGYYHSLGVSDQGLAYSVGLNKNGECGRTGVCSSWDAVDCTLQLKCAVAGFGVSFMITTENQLLACGKSNMSTFKSSVSKPSLVSAFNGGVVQICAGYNHVGCIDISGDLYMWGDNTNSKLGVGSKKPSFSSPKLVKDLSVKGIKVKQISCSLGEKHGHSACLSEDGNVYFWGDPYKGKLGHRDTWDHKQNEDVDLPLEIDTSAIGPVKKVICGGIHSAILAEDGKLYTFGCGSDGRLGHPEYEGFVYLYKEARPKLVEFFKEFNVLDADSSYYSMTALVVPKSNVVLSVE